MYYDWHTGGAGRSVHGELVLFVADTDNHRIRRIDCADPKVWLLLSFSIGALASSLSSLPLLRGGGQIAKKRESVLTRKSDANQSIFLHSILNAFQARIIVSSLYISFPTEHQRRAPTLLGWRVNLWSAAGLAPAATALSRTLPLTLARRLSLGSQMAMDR